MQIQISCLATKQSFALELDSNSLPWATTQYTATPTTSLTATPTTSLTTPTASPITPKVNLDGPVSPLEWIQWEIQQRTLLPPDQQWIYNTQTGQSIYSSEDLSSVGISSIPPASSTCCHLQVRVRTVGGKGGFGANLKSLGGRIARKKITNFESCRDLSGRRLSKLTEAKVIADRVGKQQEWERRREERIQKKIEEGLKEPSKKKIRFNDSGFFQEKEHMIDAVKDAVLRGTLASYGSWCAHITLAMDDQDERNDGNQEQDSDDKHVEISSATSSSSSSSSSSKVVASSSKVATSATSKNGNTTSARAPAIASHWDDISDSEEEEEEEEEIEEVKKEVHKKRRA